jgi:membrane protein DedA with SNARE-associated domain
MHFFRDIEHFIRISALHMPLEWFVFFGSFLEEFVSPIPSALIMGTAGSIALVRHEPLWYLLWLAAFGNVGKTFGAWLYYFIGDKLEDLLIKRVTGFFGVKHEEIENIGKRFTGHHWKDGSILFALRFIPFIPTTPVSIAAGIIKMDVRVFLIATYLGNILKDIFYIYAGYAGLATLHTLWRKIMPLKMSVDIVVAIGILVFFIFLYMHRGQGQKFFGRCTKYCTDFFKKN